MYKVKNSHSICNDIKNMKKFKIWVYENFKLWWFENYDCLKNKTMSKIRLPLPINEKYKYTENINFVKMIFYLLLTGLENTKKFWTNLDLNYLKVFNSKYELTNITESESSLTKGKGTCWSVLPDNSLNNGQYCPFIHLLNNRGKSIDIYLKPISQWERSLFKGMKIPGLYKHCLQMEALTTLYYFRISIVSIF